MKLFLIRHAETEHNVKGLLAGVTDSRLTNHGILQTQRLGEYLASQQPNLTQIFTSDLQRAKITADAIREAQLKDKPANSRDLDVFQLTLLREQDFGSYECTKWTSKAGENDACSDAAKSGFVPKETKESMKARAEEFLDDYFMPLLYLDSDTNENIVVVSHGLFLSSIWKALLARFSASSVILAPEVGSRIGTQLLEYFPIWSNTGYLELWICPKPSHEPAGTHCKSPLQVDNPSKLEGWQMTVKKVNAKDHLQNLKRTGGGIGSVTYDARQQRLDGFFKKPMASSRDS